MNCPKCGAENISGVKTCTKCGASFLSPALDETTSILSPVPEAEEELPEVRPLAAEDRVLVVKKGPNIGARYSLEPGTIVLGRDPQCDIFLNDITVSRKHAKITVSQAETSLTDLESLNGTYVNSSRIENASLQNGDVLQIGKFKLVYFTP